MTFDFSQISKCKPDISDSNYICPLCKGSKHLTLKDGSKKVKCVCYTYIKAYSVLGKDLYSQYEILDPNEKETEKYDLSSLWGKSTYFWVPDGTKKFKPYLAQTIMKMYPSLAMRGFRFAYEEFFELMQIYLGHRGDRYSDLLDFIQVNPAFFIRIGDTEMTNKHLDQAMRQFVNSISHREDKFIWFISSHSPSSDVIQNWYSEDFKSWIAEFDKEKIV
jgi:hypothetical protein